MTHFILVHGGNLSSDTWNQLTGKNDYPLGEHLGGKIWSKCTSYLQNNHHNVFAPTLLDEHTHTLSDHIEQICDLITKQKLTNVILVGASYGGMIITGVAQKMPQAIACLAYIDAAYPISGQSLCDILKAAQLNPPDVLGGLPKAYCEPLTVQTQKLQSIPKVYVQCTQSSFLPVTTQIKQRINSEKNWHWVEIPTSHIPHATMPDELNELLLTFIHFARNLD